MRIANYLLIPMVSLADRTALTRRAAGLVFAIIMLAAAGCRQGETSLQARERLPAPAGETETGPATGSLTQALPAVTESPSTTPAPLTATRMVTPTASATPAPTPTERPLPPAASPTYAILRGEVMVRANCRYGPGFPYLYKYGLVVGSHLEVFGRNDLGTWILIRAIGGTNPCWVKASLMELEGEVMSVQPTYIPLPMSPYYPPLKGVTAARQGEEVTIYWSPRYLRAGDSGGDFRYVVEAWVCQAGTLVFTPVGANTEAVTLVDEPGCVEASHARVYLAEKHGYSRPVEVPWPGRSAN